MEEERKVLTPEEGVKWFITHLDNITLEMNRGIYKILVLYRRGRYELKILRENAILFAAEGVSWEIPVRALENHILFLKLAAATLRETLRGIEPLLKREGERENEE